MNTTQQRTPVRLMVWALLLLTVGGSLTACRDSAVSNLSPADAPVYITNYDRTTTFSQYKTFSLPDSVIVQSNDNYSTTQTVVSSQFVNDVARNLTARGYQRVARGQQADLGVAVIFVDNQYTAVASNPYSYYSNYWGYGGYGGLGGYGGYYPYYPSYYTYQVSNQYWEIQMVDLKNAPAATNGQQQLNVIYDATIRGTDVPDAPTATSAVTAIFNQSPYLQATR